MELGDREKFLAVVIGFAELKGKSLSPLALELYWRAMSDWTLKDFTAAASHLIKSCEFMPTPKDFEDLRMAGRPTAGEAWAHVLAAARAGYDSDEHVPAARKALRAIGGIQAVMMSETSKTHFLERRFCEHYEAIQDAECVREELPQLAGPQNDRLLGIKH